MASLERVTTADDDKQSVVGEWSADHTPRHLTNQLDYRLRGERHHSYNLQTQGARHRYTQRYLTDHTQTHA